MTCIVVGLHFTTTTEVGDTHAWPDCCKKLMEFPHQLAGEAGLGGLAVRTEGGRVRAAQVEVAQQRRMQQRLDEQMTMSCQIVVALSPPFPIKDTLTPWSN